MATFKRVGTIDTFRAKFINGMTARGYERAFAERCFQQIEGFGSYGFPESHAASFANLVYASCWIKCHYPDVFAAALINSQPMGFYAPAQIVRDAQEHGVALRPVDVNFSDWDCTLEAEATSAPVWGTGGREENSPLAFPPPLRGRDREGGGSKAARDRLHSRHASMRDDVWTTHAIRLGFRQISGMAEDHARIIEQARGRGFDSVRDLWLRTQLPPAVLERLAQADAVRSLGLDRRDALWAVRALQRAGDKDDLPLFARVTMPGLEPDVALPPMLPGEHVIEDYRHLRLSLKEHPVSFLRDELTRRGIPPNGDLPNVKPGRRVTVAGLVLVRQRPGEGKAIFMTLEDETGIANTIMWLRTYEAYRPIVLGARFIAVTGQLQNEQGVIHIVAEHFEDLTPLLRKLSVLDAAPTLSYADHVKHGGGPDSRGKHPRSGDSLVRLLRENPALAEELLGDNAEVMPKGRNFH
jgi:error-prone DNA polymerase